MTKNNNKKACNHTDQNNYYIPTHPNCVITENNVDTPITITCDLLINSFISNNITV